jgi:hypothetical protein
MMQDTLTSAAPGRGPADNHYVVIHDETYFFSADGYPMPAKKNQPVGDLRYFDQTRK